MCLNYQLCKALATIAQYDAINIHKSHRNRLVGVWECAELKYFLTSHQHSTSAYLAIFSDVLATVRSVMI